MDIIKEQVADGVMSHVLKACVEQVSWTTVPLQPQPDSEDASIDLENFLLFSGTNENSANSSQ